MDKSFRSFLETSRDFHKIISKNERTMAYYAFGLAAGTIAMTGAGVYIAVESDPMRGLITVGFSGYATKLIGEIGTQALHRYKRDSALAEERQNQLDDFEESQGSDET